MMLPSKKKKCLYMSSFKYPQNNGLELCQILIAAGDTFRAAASDQLEIWAERTGCEIVVAEREKAKASSGRQLK